MATRYAEILHRSSTQEACIAKNLPTLDYRGMGTTEHKMEVAARLRLAVEAIGVSQVDICRELEISTPKLNNWLRGDHYPDPWFIKRFCDRYGITADWIYRGVASGAASGVAAALWRAAQASGAAERAADHPAHGSRKK